MAIASTVSVSVSGVPNTYHLVVHISQHNSIYPGSLPVTPPLLTMLVPVLVRRTITGEVKDVFSA
jgi:hypothetical protein